MTTTPPAPPATSTDPLAVAQRRLDDAVLSLREAAAGDTPDAIRIPAVNAARINAAAAAEELARWLALARL